MKKQMSFILQWILIIFLLSVSIFKLAAQQQSSNKTEAPYFFIKSDNPQEDQLPLP